MPRVVCDPKIMGGRPCIAGTRVTIYAVRDSYYQNGHDLDKVQEDYPFLSRDDIIFAVALASVTGEFSAGDLSQSRAFFEALSNKDY